MKKVHAKICIGIFVVIFAISLVRIAQCFFTIYIYYDYVIWCGKEDKSYIQDKMGVSSNFSIACGDLTFRCENQSVTLINGFPSVFSKEKIIEAGIDSTIEYIKERSNKFEAMIKCSLPYIVGCIAIYIIYYKKLLSILTEE